MAFIAQDDSGSGGVGGLAAKVVAALRKPALGLKRAVEVAAFLPGVLLFVVVAPLVLVAEIVRWLRSGVWPAWSFGDILNYVGNYLGIGPYRVAWVGLQGVFDLVLSAPGSLGIFATGLAMVAAVTALWDREAKAKAAAAKAPQ